MELYLSRVLKTNGDAENTLEQWIRLPINCDEELNLGRSCDSPVRLLSPHISRNHALIKRCDSEFWIKDLNSLNGIHINDRKIETATWHRLCPNDRVEIGKPDDDAILKTMCNDDRFVYTVCEASFEKVDAKPVGPKCHMSASIKKMIKTHPHGKILQKSRIKNKIYYKKVENKPNENEPVSNSCNEKMLNSDKVEENETLPDVSDKMERENKRLKLELEQKDQALKEEIDLRNKKLEEEQKKIAAELEQNFKSKLEQKEEELEMRLQLEKDIAVEQCKASLEENPSATRELVVNAMENELQCSICSELFIISTTLNCAHTFCKFCITEWMKVKHICPVCRQPILTTTRSLVLDNYIEKVIENLSGELKENRLKIIVERKKTAAQKTNSSKAKQRRNYSGRGGIQQTVMGGLGRGARRGAYANASSSSYNDNIGIRTRSRVIVISDQESSSSEASFYSNDSFLTSDDDSENMAYGMEYY